MAQGYNFANWRRATGPAVSLPTGKGNPIDRLLAGYLKELQVPTENWWMTAPMPGAWLIS